MNLRDLPTPPDPAEKAWSSRVGQALQIVVGILFMVLLARLWYLQIARGADFRKASEENRLRRERKAAPRGDILDRAGLRLAGTRPKFVVSISPEQFNVDGPEGRRLAECLGLDLAELKLRARPIGPKYRRVRVAIDVSRQVLNRLEEMRPWLPGVSVDLEELRYYPNGKLAAHLLGYLGPVSQKQLDESSDVYARESRVGVAGIERFYEDRLRGDDGGIVIEVDAAGKRTRLLRQDSVKRGTDLVLTIESAVQRAAEEGLNGRVGSAVAIDPRSGEVLAMASRPSYDPNLFTSGIGNKDWRAILADKHLPLMNRAIQGAYPPASTFKLVVSMAGQQAGVISPSTGVQCTGAVYLGRHRFRCWRRHGYVDFADAIAQSCDTFFYRAGRAMGIEAIAAMARRFGFGSKTGIDLIGEKAGTVPDPSWKRKYVRSDPEWHPGETLNASIGQGYLQATSLQLACVTGAVANGGYVYKPHLVRAFGKGASQKKVTPELIRRIDLPAKYFDNVRTGMTRTVSAGTGRTAALPGITVGGKTGSAETSGVAHAWFVCAAPMEKPEIAICVMVEHGAHGATAAAPVAQDMLKAHFKLKAAPRVRVSGD